MKSPLPSLHDAQPILSYDGRAEPPTKTSVPKTVLPPKTPPVAVPAVTSLAQKIADEQAAKFVEAERLLTELVQAGRQPTFAETQFFESIGLDQKKLLSQKFRVGQVLRFQSIAGTSADRQAAEKERDVSAELLRTKGDELEQQIETLTKQLHGLQRDARLSTKRCEEMSEAADELRKLIPPFVQAEYDLKTSEIFNGSRKVLNEMKIRCNQVECLTDPERYKAAIGGYTYLDAVKTYDRSYVERKNQTDYLGEKWQAHVQELLAELQELKPQIDILQKTVDAELLACESTKDFYVR